MQIITKKENNSRFILNANSKYRLCRKDYIKYLKLLLDIYIIQNILLIIGTKSEKQ